MEEHEDMREIIAKAYECKIGDVEEYVILRYYMVESTKPISATYDYHYGVPNMVLENLTFLGMNKAYKRSDISELIDSAAGAAWISRESYLSKYFLLAKQLTQKCNRLANKLFNKHMSKEDKNLCLINIKLEEIDEYFESLNQIKAKTVKETRKQAKKADLGKESKNASKILKINEREIQDYLWKHLEEIEDGLRPLSKEYKLERGRIDLLAIDKENKYVIIETKVERDTDLIWQRMYYESELKKEKGGEMRFIVIAPNLDDDIIEALNKIGQWEYIRYFGNRKDKNLDIYLDKKPLA